MMERQCAAGTIVFVTIMWDNSFVRIKKIQNGRGVKCINERFRKVL